MPLDKIIAERTEELPYQELGKLLSIVAKDKSIISFGPGQPDFGPPPHVIKAAQLALNDPASSRYSSPEGSMELRESVSEKLRKENKIDLSADEILITSGSCEAILLSMLACIDPGEEVAVVDPSYINYIPSVELLNGSAISLPVVPSCNWQLLPEMVKKQIKEPKRMRAIIINTPANPTGAVYTRKTLEEVADIARDNDMMIVSDEAYEKFVFGKAKHVSIGSLNGMKDYVLTLQSFSKTYGMPGFRVGYAAGPKKVIDVMRELHLFASMCAPTLSQIAAVAALKGPQDSIRKHTTEYGKRREFLLKRLEELGFVCDCDPEGAFYMFPKVPVKMTSVKFAHWLMKEAKVLVVPGSDFGRYGEGYVRFSYSTAMPRMEEGLARIEKAMKKLK